MHEQNQDPHEIFENRMLRFKAVIDAYQRREIRQIQEKGDREEEFEVAKIRNDARGKDEGNFKKMEDNIKVAEKIFKSRKINECKMKEMKVRFEMVEKVQEETKKSLKHKTQDPKAYRALLKDLIKQGLIKLLEENVEIRCLKSDEQVVREVMAECQRQFNEDSAIKTSVKINLKNPLVEADIGGVTLTTHNGRIVCDNTLRARLNYCMQMLLPEIRDLLFHDSDEYLSNQRKLKREQEAHVAKH